MPDEISSPDTNDQTANDEATSSQLVQSLPESEDRSAAEQTYQGERSSGGYVSKDG